MSFFVYALFVKGYFVKKKGVFMKEKKKRLKMSNRAFRTLLIIPMVLVSLIVCALNVAANMMSSTADTYLGSGEYYISGGNGADADYYETAYTSNAESTAAGSDMTVRIVEEGSILMKNNGLLPVDSSVAVMPFGYAYLNPNYAQASSGGSGKWIEGDTVTPEEGLAGFDINSAAVEAMKAAGDPEVTVEADGTMAAGEAGSILGGDCKLYEYDPSIYDGIESVEDTIGLVFVTRVGQEGQDQKYDAYEDGTPHYLALSEDEKGTIEAAKRICGKVVVVLVSSAAMELTPIVSGDLEADAILWMGHPGQTGFAALAEILDGTVNPSGRTVDIYTSDMTADPSYQNIGSFAYSNLTSAKCGYMGSEASEIPAYYLEYQEGMYMGYRYYETADEMDESFVYGQLDEGGAVTEAGAVIYPFGYGLSYTSFRQELLSLVEEDGQVTAEVKVTNTGDYAGKEVVQLYYGAPYTEMDVEYLIEKPSAQLIAFDKTQTLNPGDSEVVTLTFAMEDMASYCYTHENSNGTTGCYVLEEGEYVVSLRKNSHEVIDEASLTMDETFWYDGSDDEHIRETEKLAQSAMADDGTILDYPAAAESGEDASYVAATNQFQTSSDYMNENSTLLTRSDWANTQPSTDESRSKEIEDEFASQLGIEVSFDVETDAIYGNVEGSLVYAEEEPVSGADNGLVLSDLRGASYYDERWDLLLDQIDWDKDADGILQNFSGDAYTTAAISSIGLMATVDEDGANGLKVNGASTSGYDMTQSATYPFHPMLAATWNPDLMYEFGETIGEEALMNGISGWYSPGLNLHRSQFSGRVFEYLSEDPVLSGKLAAQMISGAGNKGLYCYIKHFVLNETETNRDQMVNVWADEQTMRELYMKAFEIAIKEATMTISYYDEDGTLSEKTMRAATAIMPAQLGVGTTVGECNYNLLQNVLRGEWGFQGMAISDYWVWGDNSIRDLALRSGCDTYLCMYMPSAWSLDDTTSATARTVMRQAIKNICYTVVNSNAMQGYAPGAVQKVTMSPWKKILIAIDVIWLLILLLDIVWMVKRAKDEKMHPENYKRKVKKAKKVKNA